MTSTRPSADGPRAAESSERSPDARRDGRRPDLRRAAGTDSGAHRRADTTRVAGGSDPVASGDAGPAATGAFGPAATGDPAPDAPTDERALYGEPCHEVDADCDERTLYGDPQHETDAAGDGPDPDLLFAWFRATTFSAPSPGAQASRGSDDATER